MRFLLLFLLAISAQAAVVDVNACGAPLSTVGDLYRVTKPLAYFGSGSCLKATAPNITIDCGGNEIVFQGTGIDLGDKDGIEIRNCILITAPTNYTTAAFSWFAIRGHNNSASNIYVHHNEFRFNHDTAPEPYGFFVSNLPSDNVRFEDNTCTMGGAYRSTCIGVTGAGAKTNWKVLRNKINAEGTANGRPTGVDLQGTVKAEVAHNEVYVNSPQALGKIDEFQSISCFNCVEPDVHHNTITEYGTHGRVFSIDNVTGGSFHHNDVKLWGNGEKGTLQGFGLRGNTVGVELSQNTVDALGCGSFPQGACVGLWIGNDTNPGDNTFPTGNLIHDNWFRVDGRSVAIETTDQLGPRNRFWNITIECSGDSRCVGSRMMSQPEQDVEMAYFDIRDTTTRAPFEFEAASLAKDFRLCAVEVNGSPLNRSQTVGLTLPAGEPKITEAPCLCAGLGCGPVVGARSDAPAEPQPEPEPEPEPEVTRADLDAVAAQFAAEVQALKTEIAALKAEAVALADALRLAAEQALTLDKLRERLQ